MNIGALLSKWVEKNPDKAAIIFKDQRITFRVLYNRSFRLAENLIRQGIQKGDTVAVYLPNWPEYIISYLAVWFVGATVVPLDFMLTQDELSSCISHAEAKALIAKSKPSVSWDALKEACPQLATVILCHENKEPYFSFEVFTDGSPLQTAGICVKPNDYAIIFYTSGTTGKPKGVLISYQQLEAPPKNVDFFVQSDIRPDDIALCALPFSHLGGLIFIQELLVNGTTMVLMERFAPTEFLRLIQSHKVNWFWLVPSMYYALLQMKEFESYDLSTLRWLVIFGAPSSPSAIRRFHAHCPHAHLYHGWGLTETNAPTVVLPTGSTKIESVGRPAPWIEIKIFDENDLESSQGSIGEIVVKSWVVTDGYFKDPQLTEQTIRNGWFHTGDLGRIDSDGYLYIVGRKKEMIKVAGEIVFEPEVEAVLHKHEDIAEAAVIGVADKMRGEVPKAFVVLRSENKLTEDQLRYFLREHLAHFKIPHYFEFCDSLPKNRAGKIDKEKLRSTCIA
ncbi:MAG: acyl--CoA ligase [Candidatus Omnitrophica bacterium]|nr:acyl--CoA ligase [Candidatus Omnitrophota bacterium]